MVEIGQARLALVCVVVVTKPGPTANLAFAAACFSAYGHAGATVHSSHR